MRWKEMLPTPRPSNVGPEWSVLIMVVAALFLLAVFTFYYFTR
jgi:hypothetical protein